MSYESDAQGTHRSFRRSTDTVVRVCIVGVFVLAAGGGWALNQVFKSSYITRQNVVQAQPVQFSHKHHVADDGIDCRYCHTTVERSAFAGMPPTQTCMNCHSQLWTTSDALEPVRASFQQGEPIHWNRVNNLQEFVYFDHSIHVSKGVGCATCHGRVDEMPATYQAEPLTMQWCLACHREPEKFIRPREEVFNMDWQPPADQIGQAKRLIERYHVKDARTLTNCSTCHR